MIALLQNILYILFEMGPYILIGLFLSGLIHLFMPNSVMKKLDGNGLKGPLLASLFGVPLPLCSCSVIPLAVQMKRSGARNGSVIAFLTSAPQTGVDSILVAYSFFGWPFALFKSGVSFISGTLGGWISNGLHGGQQSEQQENVSPSCNCSNCDGQEEEAQVTGENRLRTLMFYGFNELLGDFALHLLIGIGVASVITTVLPAGFLGRLDPPWLYYPAVLALSIPFYICATSSIPLAFALATGGMPLGAVIVFLIAGPATNLATLGVIGKTLGRSHVIVFLLTISVLSILFGVVFDTLGLDLMVKREDVSGFEFPYLIQVISGIILAVLLVYHAVKRGFPSIFAQKG